MTRRDKPTPKPRPHVAAPDPEEEFYKSELDIHNRVGEWAHANGLTHDLGDENMQPDHEDAIAHLKQLPPKEAIAKAREWTGRDDINTVEEAISAVEAATKQE